ncbi:hypothetical protein AVEN_51224-1 [Araneus ventricosus]|uniref:Uncharacterized protein n=1 Tax=Araneus ventricosus TaxID=182803 RepID=A0A4Y2BNR6_ARAVE|nr:hypothetical protein AVEN_51224-1 [Araneus ventricosus]
MELGLLASRIFTPFVIVRFGVVTDSSQMALLCILWQRLPPPWELDCVAGMETEGMA